MTQPISSFHAIRSNKFKLINTSTNIKLKYNDLCNTYSNIKTDKRIFK